MEYTSIALKSVAYINFKTEIKLNYIINYGLENNSRFNNVHLENSILFCIFILLMADAISIAYTQ